MTDRPIIFSAPMVQALLDGRKTQDRRVIPNRVVDAYYDYDDFVRCVSCGGPRLFERDFFLQRCRYAIGDRLWVREAFCPRLGYHAPVANPHYRADDDRPEWRGLWKPSIHMPRWASRLTLTVTDVRVQRLQDISEADAIAEGIFHRPSEVEPHGLWTYEGINGGWHDPIIAYRSLCNSLQGPDTWDANPWVAALTFTVQRGNIDKIGGE